jgi:hypothetical protein
VSDNSNIFLIVWDCLGVETVINTTQYEHEITWGLLQNKPAGATVRTMTWSLLARARANEHRNYEIYTIQVEAGVTEADVKEMFHNDPQGSADLIRARGNKIYSNRLGQEQRVIV